MVTAVRGASLDSVTCPEFTKHATLTPCLLPSLLPREVSLVTRAHLIPAMRGFQCCYQATKYIQYIQNESLLSMENLTEQFSPSGHMAWLGNVKISQSVSIHIRYPIINITYKAKNRTNGASKHEERERQVLRRMNEYQ